MLRPRSERDLTAPASPESQADLQARQRAKKEAALFEQAAALGFACFPIKNVMQEIATAISTRMRTRLGLHIYQSVSHMLPGVPLIVAKQIFPEERLTEQSNSGTRTWVFENMEQMEPLRQLLQLSRLKNMAGLTRAMLKPSESVVRVAATLIPPVEISLVKVHRGVNRLYLNFDFVLSDETGELHPPKDPSCREKLLTNAEIKAIRQQIYKDLVLLSETSCPLSPAFLRQIGMESRALTAEAILKNSQMPGQQQKPGRKVSKRHAETFSVECILAQSGQGSRRQFLVQWEGYSPEWEPWRIDGNVGDPIATWEPWHSMKNTEALERWEATPLIETESVQ